MPAPTNAERGRAARSAMLTAARELIAEIGWNAVSTRILAERAGVRSGLVHYHFESLQALLRRATLEAMQEMLDGAAPMLDGADPAEAIEGMVRDLDRYSGVDDTSLLFIEGYLAAARDPELHEQLTALLTRFRDTVAAALARADHPSPEAAAAAVLASLDGFVLHKGLNPELTAELIAPMLRRITESHVSDERVTNNHRTDNRPNGAS